MGSHLSCASSSDPYLNPLDYSVTVKPSDDVDRASVASLQHADVDHSRSTADIGGWEAPGKNMDASCNGHTVDGGVKRRQKLAISKSFSEYNCLLRRFSLVYPF